MADPIERQNGFAVVEGRLQVGGWDLARLADVPRADLPGADLPAHEA